MVPIKFGEVKLYQMNDDNWEEDEWNEFEEELDQSDAWGDTEDANSVFVHLYFCSLLPPTTPNYLQDTISSNIFVCAFTFLFFEMKVELARAKSVPFETLT